MSLNFFMRQRIPALFESKFLLNIIGWPIRRTKFYKINFENVRNKYCRQYCTKKEKNEIVKSQSTGGEVSTNFETVKETTKTLTFTGIILIGLGFTGMVSYAIFSELFSKNSPMNISTKALERCLKHEEVLLSLGEPIKAYGEDTSIGRRLDSNHLLYLKDGVNHLRMKFYIRGSRNKATVHLEMKENESGNFEYRYLFVQLDEFPYTTIVLEDNRAEKSSVLQPLGEKMELI